MGSSATGGASGARGSGALGRGAGGTGSALQRQLSAQDLDRLFRCVDFLGEVSRLDGDQAILHGMGQLHQTVQVDDPRRALDGMGRAHHRLDHPGVAGITFQSQQAGIQRLQMALHFAGEEIIEGHLAHIARWLAHRRASSRARSSRARSIRPT
ncbi:hypothetical protein NS383_16095 [Pseudomonas oryzihabitans]|nr:hypothetical protein NS383_16095 [Pseudomonas psychrotolerans]